MVKPIGNATFSRGRWGDDIITQPPPPWSSAQQGGGAGCAQILGRAALELSSSPPGDSPPGRPNKGGGLAAIRFWGGLLSNSTQQLHYEMPFPSNSTSAPLLASRAAGPTKGGGLAALRFWGGAEDQLTDAVAPPRSKTILGRAALELSSSPLAAQPRGRPNKGGGGWLLTCFQPRLRYDIICPGRP